MVLHKYQELKAYRAVIIPKISVVAVELIVNEGSAVQFNISGDEDLRYEIAVEYILSPEGDFFDGLGNEARYVRLSDSNKNCDMLKLRP